MKINGNSWKSVTAPLDPVNAQPVVLVFWIASTNMGVQIAHIIAAMTIATGAI